MLGVPRSSNRQYILLHAVIEMADPTRQGRLVGEGFKPPKGAAVKSHGAERLGLKVLMNQDQVCIWEMNLPLPQAGESEPLMRCRERSTICQKL